MQVNSSKETVMSVGHKMRIDDGDDEGGGVGRSGPC